MKKVNRSISTMEEFSKVCGISRPTLSKFFQNPNSVRPGTRKRIEAAQQKFGFNPSFYAMNMNRDKTRNIGIVVPILSDPFYAEMVRQFERRCLEAGFWLVVLSSDGDPQHEKRAIQTLLSLRLAGALVAPVGDVSDVETITRLSLQTPTVLFDAPLEGPFCFVGSDNMQSAGLLTDYLCRTGTAPMFMSIPPLNANARGREKGYVQQMRRNNLEPRVISEEDAIWEFEEVGYRLMERMITAGEWKDLTIFCASDRLAFGAMSAAFQHGLKIGQGQGADLRIAGHDNHPLSRFMNPPLTTVAQNYEEIASSSFDMLIDAIDTGSVATPVATTLIETKLMMRMSA